MKFSSKSMSSALRVRPPTRSVGVRWLGVVLIVGSCPAPASAQDALPAPATVSVTLESIQAMQSRIAERTDLDEATKASVAQRLKEAQDSLRIADEWMAKGADFDAQRTEAPARLERIRAELNETPPSRTIAPPPEASLAQLEQLQAAAEAELKAAKDEAGALDGERKRRNDRRAEIPNAKVAVKRKLDEINSEVPSAPAANESPDLVLAARMAVDAHQRALQAELDVADKELACYETRGDLLTARRDLAARRVSQAEAALQAWQSLLGERRRAEAKATAVAAEVTRREAARKHAVVRTLAEENARWAAQRTDELIADRIEMANRDAEEVARLLGRMASDHESVVAKVRAAGLTNAMGLLLRRQRESAPDVTRHRRAISVREAEISDVQVKLIELDDLRRSLADLDSVTQSTLDAAEGLTDEAQRQQVESAVRELLEARRSLVDALTSDYDSYFSKLVDLDNNERDLVGKITNYLDYIDEHVLWIRSCPPPAITDAMELGKALRWISSPILWGTTLWALVHGAIAAPLSTGLFLLSLLALLAFRPRLCRRLEELGTLTRRGQCVDITPTMLAGLLTFLIALPWAMTAMFVGRRLNLQVSDVAFSRCVGTGLQAIGFAVFVVELVRQLCRATGLAEAHLGWTGTGPARLRRHLLPLIAFGAPLFFVVSTLEALGDNDWQNSLGRLSFVLGQLLTAVVAYRVTHPRHGVFRELFSRNPTGWLARLKLVCRFVSVVPPLVLAALAIAGYFYTALRLSGRLGFSLCLVILVSVLYAFAQRWLLVVRRRVAIEQARKRQREARQAEDAKGDAAEAPPTEDGRLELATIDTQSRRLLRAAAITGVALGMWFVWIDVVPALGILQRIPLWTTTVSVSEAATAPDGTVMDVPRTALKIISVADVGTMLVILFVTYVATRNLPGLLEITLLLRLPLRQGERYAVTTLIRYVVTVVGLIIAFQAIGVRWSNIQWLAAAITVGLGFGLQEIFANFVSGLILLFERPIRIGDTVTVGDAEGTVSRIQMRATTVTDWDRKEIVIPNKEFVTGRIINWSLSDQMIRVIIPVGIAYGSDTKRAKEILLKIAEDDEFVLASPRPTAFFLEFGDSTLNLELRAFVNSIDDFMVVRDSLHDAIDQAFRDAGIEIAFPQRDVHVRSISDGLPVGKRGTAPEKA